MTVPTLTLNNQTEIPQLGFGVFQVPPAKTADVVSQALQVGYRHIDTAQMYQNEQEVGEALKAADIPREDLWITSKLNNGFHRPDDVTRAQHEVQPGEQGAGAMARDEAGGRDAGAHLGPTVPGVGRRPRGSPAA